MRAASIRRACAMGSGYQSAGEGFVPVSMPGIPASRYPKSFSMEKGVSSLRM